MKRRHLLVCSPHYHASASRWLTDAFERLGWVVTRVGPSFRSHGKEHGLVWDNDFPEVDLELPRNSTWNVDDYIDFATKRKKQTVDLCLLIEETYHNQIINTGKIPSVLWSIDGWQNSFDRRQTIKPTLALSNHPLGVIPERQKSLPEGWDFMPAAAAPWIHCWYNRPYEDRQIEFALMATPYGYRKQLCESLAAADIIVKHRMVGTKEYVETYNKAKTTYHNANTQEEIKFRFFEAAAMGCVNIADYTALYSWCGYYPYKHYIPIDVEEKPDGSFWPNFDNFIQVVKDSPITLLSRISQDAREVTLQKNTYYHRVYDMLNVLWMIQNDFDYDVIYKIAKLDNERLS